MGISHLVGSKLSPDLPPPPPANCIFPPQLMAVLVFPSPDPRLFDLALSLTPHVPKAANPVFLPSQYMWITPLLMALLPSPAPGRGLAGSTCEGPDDKYLRLCWPHSPCDSFSVLLLSPRQDGCVPVPGTLWVLKSKFHIISRCHEIGCF